MDRRRFFRSLVAAAGAIAVVPIAQMLAPTPAKAAPTGFDKELEWPEMTPAQVQAISALDVDDFRYRDFTYRFTYRVDAQTVWTRLKVINPPAAIVP